MFKTRFFRRLAALLAIFHLLAVVQVPMANAAMIGTAEVLTAQQQQVDRPQLISMLDDQGVRDKLHSMGVDRSQVEARINSLTNAELAQFNQQLSEAPAGAGIGVLGVIVLFLVIFIVTDMLCATNIFSFVKCIDR